MASSKSFVLLLCALLAFVLILSAEASPSYEETDEVEDQYEGSGPLGGEYPDGLKKHRRQCRYGCCKYYKHRRGCYKCCKHPRELLEAQFEGDTQN